MGQERTASERLPGGARVVSRFGRGGRDGFADCSRGAEDDRLGLPTARLNDTHAALMSSVLAGEDLERVAQQAAVAVSGRVAVVIPRLGVSLIAHPRPAAADQADAGPEASADGGQSSAALAALQSWVAARIRGRPVAVPSTIVTVVPVQFREEIVGVVALVQDEADNAASAGSRVAIETSVADAAYELLRLVASAALTSLAVEDARAETEQALRGAFLEELRSRGDLSAREVLRRAARLGSDVSRGGAVICAQLTIDRPGLVTGIITSEHPGALVQDLTRATDGEEHLGIYAILPAPPGGGREACLGSARRVADRLAAYATVGVSGFHADPRELGRAVREAELALEVLCHSGTTITDEIGSGVYRLLFRTLASHPDEVHEFYENTVADMVRYDDSNQTELVSTLWTYLDSNCNMNATAAAIYAHRHTIAYRLERIRELTGLDPTQSRDREELALGLKVHRLLAPGLVAQRRTNQAAAVSSGSSYQRTRSPTRARSL